MICFMLENYSQLIRIFLHELYFFSIILVCTVKIEVWVNKYTCTSCNLIPVNIRHLLKKGSLDCT